MTILIILVLIAAALGIFAAGFVAGLGIDDGGFWEDGW